MSEPDTKICFCHNVTRQQLVDAIKKGARTLYDLQADTQASTGCGGCECDVLDILEEELAKRPQEGSPHSGSNFGS